MPLITEKTMLDSYIDTLETSLKKQFINSGSEYSIVSDILLEVELPNKDRYVK